MSSEIVINGHFKGRRFTGADRYGSELVRCLGPTIQVLRPRTNLTGLPGHLWEQLQLPRLLGSQDRLWSRDRDGHGLLCYPGLP